MARTLLILLLLLLPLQAFAQLAPDAPAAVPEENVATDPFGRTTPRGTIQGYIDAVARGDEDRAMRYLDAEYGSFRTRRLTDQLHLALSRTGRLLPTIEISNAPTGQADDGLDAELDQAGILNGADGPLPLLLVRRSVDDTKVWLISAQTLAAVPTILQTAERSLVERLTPESFSGSYLFGVSLADWAALVVLAAVALLAGYLAALVLFWLTALLLRRSGHREHTMDFHRARWPLGFILSNAWFKAGAVGLGISVIAREWAGWIVDIFSIVAVVWLFFVITSTVSHMVLNSMSLREHLSVVSVTKLLSRVANAVALVVGIVIILDILGFDVSTGLAALGIGGLALALGAQKTIENLVGSVMLVVDRPIRVGDFCQFEGVFGTVEDIGIRSTRVRTLERTLVTIPNGSFSSMQIENYTLREKYLFRHTLGARYETKADAIRRVKQAIFDYLAAHPNIEGDQPGVRFLSLASDSLSIEVFAYILADDIPHSFEVQGELLLGLMDIFEREGVDFAFPSQTVYLARDGKTPVPTKLPS